MSKLSSPYINVSVFLLFLHFSNHLRLLTGKAESINNNYQYGQTGYFLSKLTSVLGYFHYEIKRFSYFVGTNKEGFYERVDNKKMPQQQSDSSRWSTLMIRAHAGSESDYQQLLSELANVIHAYLRKRLGNQHFIEDCVQESLLAIHRARHTYDPKRPFRPWFFTIVRHKMIDYLRHKNTCRKIIERHQQQADIRNQQIQSNILEDSIDNGSLLNALPTQYKEVLTLTKLLGFTGAETAKQLGITEGAVKVRVHRAINKLRQILEAED